jgi:hypothetical protein
MSVNLFWHNIDWHTQNKKEIFFVRNKIESFCCLSVIRSFVIMLRNFEWCLAGVTPKFV